MAVSFLVHVSSIPSHPLGERFAFLSRQTHILASAMLQAFHPQAPPGPLANGKSNSSSPLRNFCWRYFSTDPASDASPTCRVTAGLNHARGFQGRVKHQTHSSASARASVLFSLPSNHSDLGKMWFTKLLTGGKFSNRRIHIINEGATTECKTLSLGSDHQCHRKIELHLLYYSFW